MCYYFHLLGILRLGRFEEGKPQLKSGNETIFKIFM